MTENGLWLVLALSGFVATFSLLALGLGLVGMVLAGSRGFARRLVVVGLVLVAVSMGAFLWALTRLPQ